MRIAMNKTLKLGSYKKIKTHSLKLYKSKKGMLQAVRLR